MSFSIIEKNGKYGAIYHKREIIPPVYNSLEINEVTTGYFIVKADRLYGLYMLDMSILEIKYTLITHIGNSRFKVWDGLKCGVWGLDNWIISPKWDKITQVNDDCFIFTLRNKYGIACIGKDLIYPQYDEVVKIDGALFKVKKAGKYEIIHHGYIIDKRFDDITEIKRYNDKLIILGYLFCP